MRNPKPFKKLLSDYLKTYPRVECAHVIEMMKYAEANQGKDIELEQILRGILTAMERLKRKYRLIQAKEQNRLKIVK